MKGWILVAPEGCEPSASSAPGSPAGSRSPGRCRPKGERTWPSTSPPGSRSRRPEPKSPHTPPTLTTRPRGTRTSSASMANRAAAGGRLANHVRRDVPRPAPGVHLRGPRAHPRRAIRDEHRTRTVPDGDHLQLAGHSGRDGDDASQPRRTGRLREGRRTDDDPRDGARQPQGPRAAQKRSSSADPNALADLGSVVPRDVSHRRARTRRRLSRSCQSPRPKVKR